MKYSIWSGDAMIVIISFSSLWLHNVPDFEFVSEIHLYIFS
jgi:hypothetical protein